MPTTAPPQKKLRVEFSVGEPDTERFVTFSDDVAVSATRDWFERAGLAVSYLFGTGNHPHVVRLCPPAPGTYFNKINAIKVLRDLTGLGLKDSKDLVEGTAPGVTPGVLMVCDTQAEARRVAERFKAEAQADVGVEPTDDVTVLGNAPKARRLGPLP